MSFRRIALAAISLGVAVVAQDPLAAFDSLQLPSAAERSGSHHATCNGRVVDAAGAPIIGAQVLLFDYVPFYWALPVVAGRTGDDGRFSLVGEHFAGDELVWVTSPRGGGFAVQWRDVTLVSGATVDAGDIVLEVPDAGETSSTTLSGHLLAGDGSPLPGVLVQAFGDKDRFDPGAYAITADDGAFRIEQRAGYRDGLQLFFVNRKVSIEHEAGVHELRERGRDWPFDLSGEIELRHESFAAWVAPASLAARLDRHYVPLPSGRVAVVTGDYASAAVVVSVPGRLPEEHSLRGESVVPSTGEAVYELRVTTPGGPASGAKVDICRGEGDFGDEQVLSTVVVDAEARLSLLGPADRRVVIYVTLPGHEPERRAWRAGEPLQVALRPRSAQVAFTVPEGTHSLFVRAPRSFGPVAICYPQAGQREVELSLCPGDYDVTAYGDGTALAVQRVEVGTPGGGRAQSVVLSEDQRPEVVVLLPAVPDAGDEKWWAYGGVQMLGGMVSRWQITSGGGRQRRTRDLDAEVEQMPGDEPSFRLRFPAPGRWFVQCGHGKKAHRYFAPIDLELGAKEILTLPALDARLAAEATAYGESWTRGFAIHGIAGPRLMLRPDRRVGDRWGVLVALPEPAKFELADLPAGHFVLGQHLYETGVLWSDKGHFGEVPVTLVAGDKVDVGKLGADGVPAKLLLVDADGAPMVGQLTLRDRMFDAWSAVAREGSTLRDADDPIPTPPSQRLVDGEVTLPRVRPGRVEFELRSDDGVLWRFERDLVGGEQPQRIELRR